MLAEVFISPDKVDYFWNNLLLPSQITKLEKLHNDPTTEWNSLSKHKKLYKQIAPLISVSKTHLNKLLSECKEKENKDGEIDWVKKIKIKSPTKFAGVNISKLIADLKTIKWKTESSFSSRVLWPNGNVEKDKGCCSGVWTASASKEYAGKYIYFAANITTTHPEVVKKWHDIIENSEIGDMLRQKFNAKWVVVDGCPMVGLEAGLGRPKAYFMAFNLHRAIGDGPSEVESIIKVRETLPDTFNLQECILVAAALTRDQGKSYLTYASAVNNTNSTNITGMALTYYNLWNTFVNEDISLPSNIENAVAKTHGTVLSSTGGKTIANFYNETTDGRLFVLNVDVSRCIKDLQHMDNLKQQEYDILCTNPGLTDRGTFRYRIIIKNSKNKLYPEPTNRATFLRFWELLHTERDT